MFGVFKKLCFNRFVAWQIIAVAFFLILVALFSLNVYFLSKAKESLGAFEGASSSFDPKRINVTLMEGVLSNLEARRAMFEDGLLKAPKVQDPSI